MILSPENAHKLVRKLAGLGIVTVNKGRIISPRMGGPYTYFDQECRMKLEFSSLALMTGLSMMNLSPKYMNLHQLEVKYPRIYTILYRRDIDD